MQIGLAQTERALQERLLVARRDHDLENQDKENQLDIVMDKMRQDANDAALSKNLKKVSCLPLVNHDLLVVFFNLSYGFYYFIY